MHAYCYASGQIGIADEVPNGALPIARGRERAVRRLIEATARHAYDGTTLLVPGVPEAPNQNAALKALHAYVWWITPQCSRGVRTIYSKAAKRAA
jgi:hypothetical protein